MSVLAPYDREELRRQFNSAQPFRWLKIDNFLKPDFAALVEGSYPDFSAAVAMGQQFKAVNENLKVQVCDWRKFTDPVKRLSDTLASPEFLRDLAYITGIPDLLWDEGLAGGGMHQTARSGWLDVHIDFNYHDQINAHRRLNILVFLNPVWEESWGGLLELWDDGVVNRHHAFIPAHNRCVVFETTQRSWHGVTAVQCPNEFARKSFAAYYYTREAPAQWDGSQHTTVFKPRPDEYVKRYVYMPASSTKEGVRKGVAAAKGAIKKLLGRSK